MGGEERGGWDGEGRGGGGGKLGGKKGGKAGRGGGRALGSIVDGGLKRGGGGNGDDSGMGGGREGKREGGGGMGGAGVQDAKSRWGLGVGVDDMASEVGEEVGGASRLPSPWALSALKNGFCELVAVIDMEVLGAEVGVASACLVTVFTFNNLPQRFVP